MNYKNLIYLCYFIAIGLCPSCCCNKPPCPDFSIEENSWMPYKNYDTIVFASNFNNKITYKILNYDVSNKYDGHPGAGDCSKNCEKLLKMDMHSKNYPDTIPQFYLIFKKRKDGIDLNFQSPDSINYFDLSKAKFLNSLLLNNINYFNVYYTQINQQQKNKFYKYYFVKGKGLIGFESYDNEVYGLKF